MLTTHKPGSIPIDSGISKEDAIQSTHQYDPIKNLNMQEKVILKKLFEENR